MIKGEIEIRCKINTYSVIVLTVTPIKDKQPGDKRYKYYYLAKVVISHIATSSTLFQEQCRTKAEALDSAVEFLDTLGACARNIVIDSASIKAYLLSGKNRAKGPNKKAIKEALSSKGALHDTP